LSRTAENCRKSPKIMMNNRLSSARIPPGCNFL
jgi:hypothetical protein